MPRSQVRVFEDPTEFAEAVRPYLDADPAETSVVATVLADVLSGARVYPGSTWLAVEDAHGVSGVAMRTPPHRLWLSPMSDDAAAEVAELMAGRAAPGTIPGIAGAERAAEVARQGWNRLRPEEPIETVRRLRLYVLAALHPPKDVPGQAREAVAADLELLMAWWEAFSAEAEVLPTHPREGIEPRLRGHGALLVWEDDGIPVAMAGHTVASAGSVRVGPVYTPPEHRRRGYGAAVTAAATQHALDDGVGQVVLFTDLGNPVSNSIYQRIGFRPLRDYVEMDRVSAG